MTDKEFDDIRNRHTDNYGIHDEYRKTIVEPILEDEGILIEEIMRLRRQIQKIIADKGN